MRLPAKRRSLDLTPLTPGVKLPAYFSPQGEFEMSECERCAADVEAGEKVCADCSRSVPMFEQSTTYQTVLDMLVELEENQLFTTT